jgi:hypothetical protein
MMKQFLGAPVVTGLAMFAVISVTAPAPASAATTSCIPVHARLDLPSLAEAFLPDTRVLTFDCEQGKSAAQPGAAPTFILPVRDATLAARILEVVRRAEAKRSPLRISFDRRGGTWNLGSGPAIEIDRIEF